MRLRDPGPVPEVDLTVPRGKLGRDILPAIELCRQEHIHGPCHERGSHHQEPGNFELPCVDHVGDQARRVHFSESSNALKRLEFASSSQEPAYEVLAREEVNATREPASETDVGDVLAQRAPTDEEQGES